MCISCPNCASCSSAVIEKRNSKKGIVRRRRQCKKCGFRFTTYELLKELYVVKLAKDKLSLTKRKMPLKERAKQEVKQRTASKKTLEFMRKFGIKKFKG